MRSEFVRWSGGAGMAGGGLGILGAFLQQPFPGMYMLTGLFTLLGVIGVLVVLRSEGLGRWGWFGLGSAFVGNVFFAVERFAVLAGLMYGLGLVLLAVGAWKSGAFPRWASVSWILAPLIGTPALFLPGSLEVLTTLGTVAFGLGFIGVGYAMWGGRSVAAAARP